MECSHIDALERAVGKVDLFETLAGHERFVLDIPQGARKGDSLYSTFLEAPRTDDLQALVQQHLSELTAVLKSCAPQLLQSACSAQVSVSQTHALSEGFLGDLADASRERQSPDS